MKKQKFYLNVVNFRRKNLLLIFKSCNKFYKTIIHIPVGCLCRKLKLILESVLFVLFREARCLAVRRLSRMQKVIAANFTEGKICFSHYSIKVTLFHIST